MKRLTCRCGKEKESLSYLGLSHYKHYIDYSHGYAEYEISYFDNDGLSLDEIKRDLGILEQDIRPKQTTIDIYLDKNSENYSPKFFKLLKGYLPISEFSIEPNKSDSYDFLLEYTNDYELQDFIDFSLVEPKTYIKNTIKKS